jgi:hypothetical protein
MAISYSGGIYTLQTSGSYTPTDLYNYNSSGITRLNGSRIVYDFGSSQIRIGSGCTFTVDTDDDYGEIMFSNPGWDDVTYKHHIWVQSGGTLNLGNTYSQDLLMVSKEAAALSYRDQNREWRIDGTLNWYGGVILGGNMQTYSGSDGTIEGYATFGKFPGVDGGSLRISEADFVPTALRFFGGAVVPFVATTDPIKGLTFVNCDTQPAVGLDNNNTSGAEFMECEDWDVSDPSNARGFGYWDQRWAKYINQATGTDFNEPQGNLADNSNNRGLLEVRQSITFEVDNGSGAKFYTVDTNNGSRLASNQIVDNPSYTSNRSYTLTESGGSASYTTDGGVLIGVYWRTTGGLQGANNNFDSRGLNNNQTDIFNWLKVEYGKQPATLDVVMKGVGGVNTSILSLPDNGITETNKAVVSAYSMSYNNTTKTLTISGDYNASDAYDYMRYVESENPNYVWDNGKEGLVTSVQTGVYNFNAIKIVVASGGTLTVDTDETIGSLVFGDRTLPSNAIKVQSGGELVTGQAGSLGTSITFNVTAEATQAAAYDQTYANINVESGGTWTWVSTTIDTHLGICVAGTVTISGTASLINSGEYLCGSLSPYLRMDSANLTINGFETNSITCSLVTQYSGFSDVTFKNALIALSVSGGYPADTWALASGLDFTDVDNQYDVGYYGNRWFRLSNLSDGTGIVVVGNSADSAANTGLVEVRQAISFSAASGSGAKFYTEDTDNSNRLAGSQIGSNPSYTADRTYTLTESSGTASYTTDGGVLTGVHWRDTGGLREDDNEFDSRGTANDNTDIFNWMKVQYGYQPATLDVEMKGVSTIQSSIAQLVDGGITQATKSTVAAYTGIACSYASGDLTITISSTHTWPEVYDYIKYWESENPANVWANGKISFVTTADGKNYTFNNAKIVIASGGDITINPENETLVIPAGNSTPCITNNGTLRLGVKTGQQYTAGVALRCEIPSAATSTNATPTNGLLYSSAVSAFYGYGATIESMRPVSIIGGTSNEQDGTVVIERLTFRSIDATRPVQIRFDNNSGESVNVSGLTLTGVDQPAAVLFATDYTSFSATFEKAYVQTFYHAPSDLELNNTVAGGNLADFTVGLLGDPNSADDIHTFVNVDVGSEMVVDAADAGSYRRGAVEIKSELTIRAVESDGTRIEGAKAYLPTYNDGNQNEPNGRSVGWTTEPGYTFTTNAQGEDTEEIQIATITNEGLAPSTNDIVYSYRGISGDDSDDFEYILVAYGFTAGTQAVVLKGSTGVTSSRALLVDVGITQATKATVAAYTGIAPVYAIGELTITVTENHTINEVYDYIKYWESENPDAVWNNDKTSFISTANKLSYVYYNLNIIVNGSELTGDALQVLPTKPAVLSGGYFEDDEGIIWESGGEIFRASRFNGIVFDADSSLPIENVAIGYGDIDTEARLLFDTNLVMTGIVTDSQGKAEGFAVYQKDSTTYNNRAMIFTQYEYLPVKIPRSFTGDPIGSSASPEATRLNIDLEVTKTETQALAVAGITVNHVQQEVDASNNTNSDLYDNIKARQASTSDIEAGVPGCMSLCLHGQLINKSGNTFSGTPGWRYKNISSGGTWSNTLIEFNGAGSYTHNLNNVTIDLIGNGTYSFSGAIGGTLTITNSTGSTGTVVVPPSATVDNQTSGDFVVDQSVQASFTFTVKDQSGNNMTGYEWRLYEYDPDPGIIGTVEIDGEESASSATQVYNYVYSSDQQVTLQIIKRGYIEEDNDFTLSSSSQSTTITMSAKENL